MDFATRELFGGHVTVHLPESWIDASARQPVPDNQEAFLTPDGPFDAKLVFEIAEYIRPVVQMNKNGSTDSNIQEQLDIAAAKYYLDDLLSVTGDTIQSVNEPRRIGSNVSAPNQHSVCYLEAQIKSRSSWRVPSHDGLPGTSSQSTNWLYLLFVRLPEYGSEFAVHMVVKEGNQSAVENSRTAEQVMLTIAETLDFKNFKDLIPGEDEEGAEAGKADQRAP